MRQQGGVFTGIIGQATYTTMSTGSNPTGLGRWNWVQLKGPISSTYIITAYQCIKSRLTVGTVFMQRERYLKRCNISGCLQQYFITDIVNFITSLLNGDNRIILVADINEYAVTGKLAKRTKENWYDRYIFQEIQLAWSSIICDRQYTNR